MCHRDAVLSSPEEITAKQACKSSIEVPQNAFKKTLFYTENILYLSFKSTT